MVVAERIHQYVQKLPASLQAEALDYVECLSSNLERETTQQGDRTWSSLSLTLAMRSMEDEEMPAYTTADLKEKFSHSSY